MSDGGATENGPEPTVEYRSAGDELYLHVRGLSERQRNALAKALLATVFVAGLSYKYELITEARNKAATQEASRDTDR